MGGAQQSAGSQLAMVVALGKGRRARALGRRGAFARARDVLGHRQDQQRLRLAKPLLLGAQAGHGRRFQRGFRSPLRVQKRAGPFEQQRCLKVGTVSRDLRQAPVECSTPVA